MNASTDPVERYLIRLKKALHGTDPSMREEILSDLRSLISEHLDNAGRSQAATEAILTRLGSPEALAEAYRMEGMLSEAAHSSEPLVLVRTALRWAMNGILGFATAFVLFTGYAMALGFFSMAVIKQFYPAQTGLWVGPDTFCFGYLSDQPDVQEVMGVGLSSAHHDYLELLGPGFTPVSILLGLFFFVITSRLTRWFFKFATKQLLPTASHCRS